MIVIDASNLIVGRLGTYVAKEALLGNDVVIVNSEKAVVTGKKINVFEDYLNKIHRGTFKGPLFPKQPDRILRRIIRGMLPHKKPRGRDAFKKIMCYVGIPEEFKDKKAISVDSANISKLPNLKYVDLLTISRRLGAKVE